MKRLARKMAGPLCLILMGALFGLVIGVQL
jgi:hypothetical protein